jgi:hypothetical protein
MQLMYISLYRLIVQKDHHQQVGAIATNETDISMEGKHPLARIRSSKISNILH